jgi:hypothetical protein
MTFRTPLTTGFLPDSQSRREPWWFQALRTRFKTAIFGSVVMKGHFARRPVTQLNFGSVGGIEKIRRVEVEPLHAYDRTVQHTIAEFLRAAQWLKVLLCRQGTAEQSD